MRKDILGKAKMVVWTKGTVQENQPTITQHRQRRDAAIRKIDGIKNQDFSAIGLKPLTLSVSQ